MPFLQDILYLDRLSRYRRNHPGNFIHLSQRHINCPPHVANGRSRAHCAEGDNLGHLILAILADCVLNHLMAAVIGIIQVNIRH